MGNLEIVKALLVVFGMIGPIVVVMYMVLFVWVKRCPLCGTKMSVQYTKGVVGYTCDECKHFEIKVLN